MDSCRAEWPTLADCWIVNQLPNCSPCSLALTFAQLCSAVVVPVVPHCVGLNKAHRKASSCRGGKGKSLEGHMNLKSVFQVPSPKHPHVAFPSCPYVFRISVSFSFSLTCMYMEIWGMCAYTHMYVEARGTVYLFLDRVSHWPVLCDVLLFGKFWGTYHPTPK